MMLVQFYRSGVDTDGETLYVCPNHVEAVEVNEHTTDKSTRIRMRSGLAILVRGSVEVVVARLVHAKPPQPQQHSGYYDTSGRGLPG